VWIDGVTGWSFGVRASSVHAAQEAVMRAAGHEVAYASLVGVSGLAFRMQTPKGELCPSAPHPFCGYRCVERAVRALPLSVRIFEVDEEDAEGVAEARAAVVESIERGVPVQYGDKEDGIIIGCEGGGAAWICVHPMHEDGAEPFVETTWPWGLAVYGAVKHETPTAQVLAEEVLEQAVEMGEMTEAEEYWLGDRAWEGYIETLKKEPEAAGDQRAVMMFANAWMYHCLVEHRTCAAAYLDSVAGFFEPKAGEHVQAAAQLFGQLVDEALLGGVETAGGVAPFPTQEGGAGDWSQAMRKDQIDRLERARLLERAALGEIELALDAMEGGSGADE
jgi:hypothetical protein